MINVGGLVPPHPSVMCYHPCPGEPRRHLWTSAPRRPFGAEALIVYGKCRVFPPGHLAARYAPVSGSSLTWGSPCSAGPRDGNTSAAGAIEESPMWEPEAWASSGGWPAPRETRTGRGARGRSGPTPLVGRSPEGGGERRSASWDPRAEGGGASAPGSLGERGPRGWDFWVLGRILETRSLGGGEG